MTVLEGRVLSGIKTGNELAWLNSVFFLKAKTVVCRDSTPIHKDSLSLQTQIYKRYVKG